MNSKDVDQMERHRLLRALIRPIPYAIGSPLFKLLLGNPLTRRLLAGQLSTLRKVHQDIGRNPLDASALGRFMAVNYAAYWRIHSLMMASYRTFRKYVTVENIELLELNRGKRGVVLCYGHFGVAKLANVVIARSGFDVVSLDRLDVFTQRDHVEGIGKITSLELGKRKGGSFHLKQLFQCKKALENNSILLITADGFRGSSGVEHDFLGKRRSFRRGFAELAVATDSLVIPIFGVLSEDGTIVLSLTEPMEPNDMGVDKEDRVNALCDEFIRRLEERWQESPESVHKNDLNIFARM